MAEVVIIPEGETQPAVTEPEAPTVTEIVETAEALAEKMARSSDETGAIIVGISELRESVLSELGRMLFEITEIRRELSDLRDALESAEEEIEEIKEIEEKEVKIETEEIAAEPAPVEPPPEFTPPQSRKRKWI